MTAVLISLNESCRMTSLSRTGILRLSEIGDFPARVPLYGRRFGFVRSEVEKWIDARLSQRASSPTSEAAANAAVT